MFRLDLHTTVIGASGSGKTYATVRSLAKHKGGVIFFNTQIESLPSCFIRATGSHTPQQLKTVADKGGKVNFLPGTSLEIQQAQLVKIIESLYDRQIHNVVLAVDEVHLFDQKEVKSQLKRVATTGRRFGLKGLWISQRPALIDNTLMTQSSKFIIFRTNMESDYFKRYSIPYDSVKARIEKGGQYSYVEWDWQEVKGPYKV